MKTMIKGSIMAIIIIQCFFITLAVLSKSSRQTEVDLALNNAMYQSLKVTDDKRYPINSNEDLISEFSQNFVIQINSYSDVEINIFGIDYINGFLDVEVVLHYTYTNGQSDHVTSRRSMIIDKTQKE